MDILQAIAARHSVRQYTDRPLPPEILAELRREIDACNREGGLHIQLVTEEPKAFSSFMAHYGSFRGVKNYLALVGPKSPELDEKCGYYGERLALLAQQLGLNTCWVAMTYGKVKTAFAVEPGEKLCLVVALGYGQSQGVPHKSKPAAAVMQTEGEPPAWFLRGVEAALLAPTAMNQQKFRLCLHGSTVEAKAGLSPYAKVDLGIVKYHFEVAAGRDNFTWA